jgi:hypothetical protein
MINNRQNQNRQKKIEESQAVAGCFIISGLFLLCIASGFYWGIITGLLSLACLFIFLGLVTVFSNN